MSAPTTISSLLVANRGEIARRVFRTARQMGMRCIAVYVDADAGAPFVREADEAIRLAGSYLDIDAIVAAARRTGADAVHPGYGFLAENAAFARAVMDSGAVWVGPTPDVIETMGDKLAAKRVAVEAGVPTLPSTESLDDDSELGYPLLVKASAGGGGKGMRIVESARDLSESVAAAQREALHGFGDDTVFLERYVARSRHVEIQILGDSHGELVHLGERECSIQRRHQKIIEESPSPVVDVEMRESMGAAALSLGRAMGYQSAGTVEFLVDDATREFFFLEVNTRLQVEHPVTEEVTGIDLVREQLRVAAGEPLGYVQDEVTFSGHAIEARLYAEDPATGFLPATGTLWAYEAAAEPAVRWDTGVEEGSVVGVDFDPMLAKVIAHGHTRSEAAGRLALALERLHLGGVTTNRDFLAATLRSNAFLDGDTTTDFIERVAPALRRPVTDDALAAVAVAAALWVQEQNRNNAALLGDVPSGFRNARLPPQRTVFAHGDRSAAVQYRMSRDGSFDVDVEVDGSEHRNASAIVHTWADDTIDMEWDSHRVRYRTTRRADLLYLTGAGGTTELRLVPRFTPPTAEVVTAGLVAPMPGIVLDVRCAVGDSVTKGETLVVLEAMKMEHHMNAPADGVVAEVRVVQGGQVDNGQLLVLFEGEHPKGDEA